jgi:hypothetical protein
MDIADQSISLTQWSPITEEHLNPEHFVLLCRLPAGRRGLVDL